MAAEDRVVERHNRAESALNGTDKLKRTIAEKTEQIAEFEAAIKQFRDNPITQNQFRLYELIESK